MINEPVKTKPDDRVQLINEVAERNQLSVEAVRALLQAFQSGGGKMAQFSHAELGGMGQWSSGMLMIGDFGNTALKAKVQAACDQLASALTEGQFNFEKSGSNFADIKAPETWWDSALGTPSSVGGQNHVQYAYFPGVRRLALKQNGAITIYDTGDHVIHGASQQQGATNSLAFESQQGRIDLNDLTKVS